MADRPRAADDFEAIRNAARNLGLKIGGKTEVTNVDVYYYHLNDQYWFISVTDRAKRFFAGYGFNALNYAHAPSLSDAWRHKPPSDFVFVEWKSGMTIPPDAWGRRPPNHV